MTQKAMKMQKKKMIGIAVVLGMLVLLGALGVSALQTPEAEALPEPPVAVSVTHPATDTVFHGARYLGVVEGTGDAPLSFRIGGTIARLYVQEGERVAAGQFLAELASPESAARLERARMELARAEANLQHWERERDIDKRLYEKGAVPRSKLDQTRLTYENALRGRDAARAGVDEAASLAGAAELRAPRSGVVGRIDRSAGETVMPGQPVLLLSAGARRVRADVLEKDRGRGIRQGSRAHLEAHVCPDAAGEVARVDAAVRAPLQSVRVYVDVPEACLDGLPAGAEVPVTFLLQPEADATLVPISAVDLRGGTPRVFRVGPDLAAEAVPVALGLQQGDWQQVQGALSPDDRIVVTGTTNLQPGTRVQVAEELASHTPPRGGAS